MTHGNSKNQAHFILDVYLIRSIVSILITETDAAFETLEDVLPDRVLAICMGVKCLAVVLGLGNDSNEEASLNSDGTSFEELIFCRFLGGEDSQLYYNLVSTCKKISAQPVFMSQSHVDICGNFFFFFCQAF
ncbi:hypothetical protein AYI69_g1257 [Smittium culicis]|uniref:Uncharacterized protein n=1 Tax=Smittium culicis TaxID=133412 RepID=A0A1R1YQS7_9FUNG|nr:hypothetical protein AYI69_g1257 [Smittium culicis]